MNFVFYFIAAFTLSGAFVACSNPEEERLAEKNVPVSSSSVPLSSSDFAREIAASSSSADTVASAAPETFALTVTGASGSGIYKPGTKVSLAVEKKRTSGKRFNGWTVSPARFENLLRTIAADSAEFAMPADSVRIQADFADGADARGTVVGGLRWMTANLDEWTFDGSSCYEGHRRNCKQYGRLYDWATAKNACPSGWRLPSKADWEALSSALGNSDGYKLKAAAGWASDEGASGSGSDTVGFRAIPSGLAYKGIYMYLGHHAYYWTSTEYDENSAYFFSVSYDSPDSYRFYNFKTAGYAVRCVQDAE